MISRKKNVFIYTNENIFFCLVINKSNGIFKQFFSLKIPWEESKNISKSFLDNSNWFLSLLNLNVMLSIQNRKGTLMWATSCNLWRGRWHWYRGGMSHYNWTALKISWNETKGNLNQDRHTILRWKGPISVTKFMASNKTDRIVWCAPSFFFSFYLSLFFSHFSSAFATLQKSLTLNEPIRLNWNHKNAHEHKIIFEQ